VTGYERGALRLWDAAAAGAVIDAAAEPGALAYSPDGRVLAYAAGAAVKLIDAHTGAPQRALTLPATDLSWQGDARVLSHVTQVALSGDGRVAALSSSDVLYVWSLDAGALAPPVQAPSGISRLRFAGARLFAFTPRDGVLLEIGRAPQAPVAFAPRGLSDAEVSSIDATLDGARLAWQSGATAEVSVRDLRSGAVTVFVGSGGAVGALGFSPDGRYLVAAGPGRSEIWNLASGGARVAQGGDRAVMLAGDRDLIGVYGPRTELVLQRLRGADAGARAWFYSILDKDAAFVLTNDGDIEHSGRDATTVAVCRLGAVVVPYEACAAGRRKAGLAESALRDGASP
jgi:WD40 repeat protein